MSINRISYGEAGFWVESDTALGQHMERLAIEDEGESLLPGQYDLTPQSWHGVFHIALDVESEDQAWLEGTPQSDKVGMPPFKVCIPNELEYTMLMAHPDEQNPGSGRILEAIFHQSDNDF